ncbi:helix-turn-helix transcriptional regulator [Caballeronia sordidicola]|uniref:helix-turn-helix transcriptional regulator n=1 Tax=Caballeronia sordidicola TaxID=196367 RepID=UPI00094C2F11|nr:AlpA family phage regulatory protein [Caballeronia sordidicola]
MSSNDQLKLLRIGKVIEITGIGKTTIYSLIKQGRFPEPVRIGPRMVAWRSDDVNTWLSDPRNYDLI